MAPIPGVYEIGSKVPPTFVRPEPSPKKLAAVTMPVVLRLPVVPIPTFSRVEPSP